MTAERAQRFEPQDKSVEHLTRKGGELVTILSEKLNDLFGTEVMKRTVRKHVKEAQGLVLNGRDSLTIPLTLAQQLKVVQLVIDNFGTANNSRYSFVATRGDYREVWRTAVIAALQQDEYAAHETSPVFTLNSVFSIKQLATLAVGKGLPGVFELLDGKGKPILHTKDAAVYYEFGMGPWGIVVNQINRSGDVVAPKLLPRQFKAAAEGYGGAQLRRLTGTHSTAFDFSPVSIKR